MLQEQTTSHSPTQSISCSQQETKRDINLLQSIQPAKRNPKSTKIKKTKDKSASSKRRQVTVDYWSNEQLMEYYYAIIVYALANPNYTLSWAHWKPPRYYNTISQGMRDVLGLLYGKTNIQCKTKDQLLRSHYYFRKNQKIDLLPLALNEIRFVVKGMYKLMKKNWILTTSDKERLLKFETVLQRYRQFSEKRQAPCLYEDKCHELLEYSRSVQNQIKIIQQIGKTIQKVKMDSN